jgi:hypothetical protein
MTTNQTTTENSFIVELTKDNFTELGLRNLSSAEKTDSLSARDAEGNEYGGTNGHGHEYGGTNGIGNPKGGRVENVESFFQNNLELVPEKSASINELLNSRIIAITGDTK